MLPRACSGSLYDALELSPDCTSGDVKRQYRRLALQYHPDRTGGATTERFQEIERANHILSSTVTRRLYDQFGSSGLQLVNTDSDDLEEQFRSAIRRIQCVFLVIFLLLAGLFVSACTACHLADESWGRGTVNGPQGPSSLAWALTFIPVYLLCLPVVALAVGLAISSLSSCSLTSLLLSVEAFVSIALVGTSVAALTGRTTAVTTIVTWMVWYAMRTTRKLFLIIPPVFARGVAEAEAAELRAASQAAVERRETAAGVESTVVRMTVAEVMCLGGYWFGAVLPTVVEFVCVWAFFGLCLRRAAPSPPVAAPLSFWVIFTPLVVLACARIGLKTIVVVFFSASISTAARALRQQHADTVVVEGAATGGAESTANSSPDVFVGATTTPTVVASAPTASCGDVLSSVIIFSVSELALLWMSCGWAATADRLFNVHQPPQRFYQTAWMASLPLLAVLLFPTMLALALLLVISLSGRTLLGVDRDPYADHAELDAAASGHAPPPSSNSNKESRGPLVTKGSFSPNYQSTTTARPSGQDGLADVD